MSNEIGLKFWSEHPDIKIEIPNSGDAGIDLRSTHDFSVNGINTVFGNDLSPRNITKVSTGIHVEIPEGYVGIICEKSSIAGGKPRTKKAEDIQGMIQNQNATQKPFGGIAVRGGIIDSSYRGEIIIVLQNLTNTDQYFDAGDKVAQLLIMPVATVMTMRRVESLDELSSTERGEGGFGSTGQK